MVAAIRVHKTGGPEVLTYEQVEVEAPGPGQIRIKQRACGVNFPHDCALEVTKDFEVPKRNTR